MKMRKADPILPLLLFIILASGVAVSMARICEKPSAGFKGPCISDTNCAQVCVGEGWQAGHCKGLRMRCMCQKPC